MSFSVGYIKKVWKRKDTDLCPWASAVGRETGIAFAPLEIGTKKQKLLENVKSAF